MPKNTFMKNSVKHIKVHSNYSDREFETKDNQILCISKTKTLSFKTKHRLQFTNITSQVKDFVKESKIKSGILIIQTHHTTFSVWVNESEKNLIGPEEILGYTPDLKLILDRFASPNENFSHDDIRDINNPKGKRFDDLPKPNKDGIINEPRNAHAHAHALILQSSISLIIEDSQVVLGKWQNIMLVELDHARERKVSLLAQGIEK